MPTLPKIMTLAGAACLAPAALASTTTMPATVFRPEEFFTGQTTGYGSLKVLMRRRTNIAVKSNGRMQSDGTLVLDQVITRSQKPTKMREWQLRELAPGHYTGSLTDAIGPVVGDVEGSDFHVMYKTKSGVSVDQHLVLQKNKNRVLNRMVFRKFGILVGRMSESIQRSAKTSDR